MVLFDNVTKTYPSGSIALEHINLKIEDGEFVFFVGHSGAGKTTLLRLLIGEILPTKGSIFVDDWEVNRLRQSQIPYLRRKVGFIFQDFKLLSDRTVAENVAVALSILGRRGEDIDSRVTEVLGIVHLKEKMDYFPKQLSLGEQQRVAIARAIAGETKILLADEPTGNLDPKTSWEILKIINNIHKMGKTVIMATHNIDIVNSLKKRVVVLEKAKVVRDERKGKYT